MSPANAKISRKRWLRWSIIYHTPGQADAIQQALLDVSSRKSARTIFPHPTLTRIKCHQGQCWLYRKNELHMVLRCTVKNILMFADSFPLMYVQLWPEIFPHFQGSHRRDQFFFAAPADWFTAIKRYRVSPMLSIHGIWLAYFRKGGGNGTGGLPWMIQVRLL